MPIMKWRPELARVATPFTVVVIPLSIVGGTAVGRSNQCTRASRLVTTTGLVETKAPAKLETLAGRKTQCTLESHLAMPIALLQVVMHHQFSGDPERCLQ